MKSFAIHKCYLCALFEKPKPFDKMKSISKLLLGMTAIALFLLGSCKQSGTKPGAEAETELSKQEIEESIEEILFPISDPMELYQTLQYIGAQYVGEVLNPVSNVENYLTGPAKATALGIYSADLSYATIFENKNGIDSYSKLIRDLLNELDLNFDYSYLQKEIKEGKDLTKDSVVAITTRIFYDTYEFLYKEGDASNAALMANSFYIEGLFIATHIMEDTYKNTEMVQLIYDQSKALEPIIELNKKFGSNDYLKTIQDKLIYLKSLYDATEGSLTEEQLNNITKTIEALRESLIA